MKTASDLADEFVDGFTWPYSERIEMSATVLADTIMAAIEADRAQRQISTAESIGTFTTDDGVRYEVETFEEHGIGYKITAPSGKVEYLILNPSGGHPDDDGGALADTWLYRVEAAGAELWAKENAGPGTSLSLIDLADRAEYVNHFEGDYAPAVTP